MSPDEHGTDVRDQTLAEHLEVAPLDEMTRRRLVRTAMASAAPPRRGLAVILPVAAALVIGLIVGAVLVTSPESTTTTAQQATTAGAPAPRGVEPTDQAHKGGNPVFAPAPESGAADLGDLGEVGDPATLQRAVAAAQAKGAANSSEAAALPCAQSDPAAVGLVVIGASGRGTYQGVPVTVLVGTGADGGEVAVSVRTSDCGIVGRTALGG